MGGVACRQPSCRGVARERAARAPPPRGNPCHRGSRGCRGGGTGGGGGVGSDVRCLCALRSCRCRGPDC
eukprot:11178470-Lingulodinium_polyedra.AAC.1